MSRPILQTLLLTLYGCVRRTGALSTGPGARAFQWAYGVYKRHLEASTAAQLRRWVPAGACVVDVGANVGFFTRQFADWVGPDGRVIAIEPERRNAAMLTDGLRHDGRLARVDVVEAAAGDVEGTLRLQINPDHPGDHRIADDGETVPAVTVDGLVARHPGARVSLLKIDVQGFEERVLRGAAEVLRAHAPAVFIEIDPAALRQQGSSTETLLRAMIGHDYELHLLHASGGVERMEAATIDEQAAAAGGYVDLLCLPAAAGKRQHPDREGMRDRDHEP